MTCNTLVRQTLIAALAALTTMASAASNAATVPDSHTPYVLTNAFLKDAKALGVADGRVVMATNNPANPLATSEWMFSPVPGRPGYYRITNVSLGTAKSLDSSPTAPVIGNSGNYSGQLWKLVPAGNGYYRLTNMYQPRKSLDNWGSAPYAPRLANTANYSGQLWKLEPARVSGEVAVAKPKRIVGSHEVVSAAPPAGVSLHHSGTTALTGGTPPAPSAHHSAGVAAPAVVDTLVPAPEPAHSAAPHTVPAASTAEPGPDPHVRYVLTNAFLNEAKALGVVHGHVVMAANDLAHPVASSEWVFSPVPGRPGVYQITNVQLGAGRSLGSTPTAPVIARANGHHLEQLWKLVPAGHGYYRFTSMRPPHKALDNWGRAPYMPRLAESGNYSGQLWKLNPVGAAQAGSTASHAAPTTSHVAGDIGSKAHYQAASGPKAPSLASHPAPAASSAANVPDPHKRYVLTNASLKNTHALGVLSGQVVMVAHNLADRRAVPQVDWVFTPVPGHPGYYRITNAGLGAAKSLDSSPTAPVIGNSGNYSGQLWKLVPAGGGYYRLTNMFQPRKSLDTTRSPDHTPVLANTGHAGGQYWRLTEDTTVPKKGSKAVSDEQLAVGGATPQPNAYYTLTNSSLKQGQELAVVNGRLVMANKPATGARSHLWKFTPVAGRPGYYRITNLELGDSKAIDSSPSVPTIANSGNFSGQLWRMTNAGNGYVKLSNMYQPAKSLDATSSPDHAPVLAHTGRAGGQDWKLTQATTIPIDRPATNLNVTKPTTTVTTSGGPIALTVTQGEVSGVTLSAKTPQAPSGKQPIQQQGSSLVGHVTLTVGDQNSGDEKSSSDQQIPIVHLNTLQSSNKIPAGMFTQAALGKKDFTEPGLGAFLASGGMELLNAYLLDPDNVAKATLDLTPANVAQGSTRSNNFFFPSGFRAGVNSGDMRNFQNVGASNRLVELCESPANSPAAREMLFSQLLVALWTPEQDRNQAQRDLINAFAAYIWTRKRFAAEALWYVYNTQLLNSNQQHSASVLSKIFAPPPAVPKSAFETFNKVNSLGMDTGKSVLQFASQGAGLSSLLTGLYRANSAAGRAKVLAEMEKAASADAAVTKSPNESGLKNFYETRLNAEKELQALKQGRKYGGTPYFRQYSPRLIGTAEDEVLEQLERLAYEKEKNQWLESLENKAAQTVKKYNAVMQAEYEPVKGSVSVDTASIAKAAQSGSNVESTLVRATLKNAMKEGVVGAIVTGGIVGSAEMVRQAVEWKSFENEVKKQLGTTKDLITAQYLTDMAANSQGIGQLAAYWESATATGGAYSFRSNGDRRSACSSNDIDPSKAAPNAVMGGKLVRNSGTTIDAEILGYAAWANLAIAKANCFSPSGIASYLKTGRKSCPGAQGQSAWKKPGNLSSPSASDLVGGRLTKGRKPLFLCRASTPAGSSGPNMSTGWISGSKCVIPWRGRALQVAPYEVLVDDPQTSMVKPGQQAANQAPVAGGWRWATTSTVKSDAPGLRTWYTDALVQTQGDVTTVVLFDTAICAAFVTPNGPVTNTQQRIDGLVPGTLYPDDGKCHIGWNGREIVAPDYYYVVHTM